MPDKAAMLETISAYVSPAAAIVLEVSEESHLEAFLESLEASGLYTPPAPKEPEAEKVETTGSKGAAGADTRSAASATSAAPAAQGREELLAAIRGAIHPAAATVLEISPDDQLEAFVKSLIATGAIAPLPGTGEAADAKPEETGAAAGAKPAKAEPPSGDAGPAPPRAEPLAAKKSDRAEALQDIQATLQEAARTLKAAPTDQVQLFSRRLKRIVQDLKEGKTPQKPPTKS